MGEWEKGSVLGSGRGVEWDKSGREYVGEWRRTREYLLLLASCFFTLPCFCDAVSSISTFFFVGCDHQHCILLFFDYVFDLFIFYFILHKVYMLVYFIVINLFVYFLEA